MFENIENIILRHSAYYPNRQPLINTHRKSHIIIFVTNGIACHNFGNKQLKTLTITEVADMVGYEDLLYFGKAFKKKYDVSPSHLYKKSARKQTFFSPIFYAVNLLKRFKKLRYAIFSTSSSG